MYAYELKMSVPTPSLGNGFVANVYQYMTIQISQQ